MISGALLSVGALCARWRIFKAGFQSAADPKCALGPQRAGVERGERRGAAVRSLTSEWAQAGRLANDSAPRTNTRGPSDQRPNKVTNLAGRP